MRLSKIKKKNDTFYYVIESLPGGSTKIYEVIGKHSELLKITDDPLSYARKRVEEINKSLKEDVMIFNEKIDFSEKIEESNDIASKNTSKNIGWLYLDEIIKKFDLESFFLKHKGKQKYNLYDINKHLVVNQILNPGSKMNAWENIDNYIGMNKYDLHQSYRFLTDLNNCKDELQSYLFKKTKEIIELDTSVLMYDLTNFYFETEEEDIDFLDGDNILQYGFRKYGKSKENRPNPIVHMGLFVDKNGIPISFTVEKGNTNEQETVLPIETRIIKEYGESKYIYCSDAGLNSYAIRFFNMMQGRHYVVTHSLKKTEEKEKDLIFKDLNWKYKDNDESVSLESFKALCDKLISGDELTEEEKDILKRDVIYKEFPTNHKVDISKIIPGSKAKGKIDFEETIFITFSAKFYLYQKKIFNKQLSRAEEWLEKGIEKRKNQNDPSRFIKEDNFTKSGELATDKLKTINDSTVEDEIKYHGFYAVATNLNLSIKEVLDINSNRWLIEYCFRLLKSFFDTRPMYVFTEEHIKGHLTVCYQSLLVFQILSKKLDELGTHYSARAILDTLKNMVISNHSNRYYESNYTNSKVLQSLEKAFQLKLDKKQYKMNKFTKK